MLFSDAAVYASQMEHANFHERTLHFLYIVVGWVFLELTHPLGLPTDDALAILAAILMTIALWQSRALYRELGEDPKTARWALFILFFSGMFLQQGTEPEIYALQLVFSLAAYIYYLQGRPVLAGLGLGLATLCTPLGVLAVGFFVAEAIRTRRWKHFLIAGTVAALTFLPVLAFVWRDYFYGTRGLLTDKPGTSHSWSDFFYNFWAVAKNFHWLLPYMGAGLVIAWRRRSPLLWLLAVLWVFHLPATSTLTENGVFILPIYPVLTAIVARGVVAGFAASVALRRITWVAVALYVATALFIWIEPPDRHFRANMDEGLRRCPPGSTLLTQWNFAVTLDFYGGPPRDTLIASRRILYPEILERGPLLEAIRSGQPVFLMESHYPTRGVRWFYPPVLQERHYRNHAFLPRMERELGVVGTPVFEPSGGPNVYRLHLR